MTALDTETLIALCATDVYRSYFNYVQREDLVSEGWVWVLSHPGRMEHLAEDSEENPKRATYRLRRDLRIAMQIYARREKAHRVGYAPEDEYFYDRAILEMVLPGVLNDDPEPPELGPGDRRAGSDPAEGGNWLALVADVTSAWEGADLSADERKAALLRHRDGLDFDAVGAALGVSSSEAHRLYSRAERRIVEQLGGQRPADCPYSCECHDGPLRVRPGVHSRRSGAGQLLG
jgi:DNA-directed RNA polymerase specialized sigma24 family protein